MLTNYPLNTKNNYIILKIEITTNYYNLNDKLEEPSYTRKLYANIMITFQTFGQNINKLQPVIPV